MAGKTDIELANDALAVARQARLDFCVFRKDVGIPGEVSSLARLIWLEIPEMAKSMGAKLEPDEGFPEGIGAHPKPLIAAIARDAADSRPIASWLSHHISKDVAGVFQKGSENTLNPVLDAFAKANDVVRSDAIAVESRGTGAASAQRTTGIAAMQHARDVAYA